jgi:hypothetical protein
MTAEPQVVADGADGEAVGTAGQSVAYDTTVQTPTVLIVDGETRVDRFHHWLGDDCPIRTASSRSEALDAFDETATVAIVRNELQSELKDALQDELASVAPFCRTIITTTEDVEIMFPEMDYDVCLTEPTTGETVRETVYHLMLRARYDANLCNYYQCSVQATNLEVQFGDDELADHPRYVRLTEQLGDIKQRLEAILQRFDEDDLDAVQQTIKPDVGFGRETSEHNKSVGDKYQPDTCVGCNLVWGTDPGGDRGMVNTRLGAFVWECTKCGSVQNLPDPSHRRVAWR